VNAVEDHDVVYHDRPPERRHPRIPALADGSDARSWWARSRARVATGILLTAPGTPFLFMGQEILEHRNWSDNPRFAPDTLIGWDELGRDRARRDHLEFTRDVVHLRRRLPALTRGKVRAYHVSDENRILAFHRWLEGTGDDVIVIASLCDRTWPRYALGFPWPGRWIEVFNSDYYDHLPNPVVTGNGGSVHAAGSGMHGFSFSAEPTLPANALLVFVRA
jgi:1,4-alpha-glucan branching enzyme